MPPNQNLNQPPLIHVVAQLHFSQFPRLEEKVINELHRRLMMDAKFPERIDAVVKQVELSITNGDDNDPHHASRDIQRFVFKGEGERSLVELREDRLIMKTTEYEGHDDFLRQWGQVMEIAEEVLPGFGQLLLHRVSLRYVDLIVPKPEETLSDLVTSALLPPSLTDLEATPMLGSTVKVLRTDENRHLRVMFEEIRSQEKSLTKVLPDDLVENDSRCGLSISGLSHWKNIPSGAYGLLDIEHVHVAGDKPSLSHVDKATLFQELYEKSSRTFWSVITDDALASWH